VERETSDARWHATRIDAAGVLAMRQISLGSQDAIFQRLREGGEEAVRLFMQTCIDRNRSGGMEAVEAWIGEALPELPGEETYVLVISLMDLLLSTWDIETESSNVLQ
jgi:hypothetical protein